MKKIEEGKNGEGRTINKNDNVIKTSEKHESIDLPTHHGNCIRRQ